MVSRSAWVAQLSHLQTSGKPRQIAARPLVEPPRCRMPLYGSVRADEGAILIGIAAARRGQRASPPPLTANVTHMLLSGREVVRLQTAQSLWKLYGCSSGITRGRTSIVKIANSARVAKKCSKLIYLFYGTSFCSEAAWHWHVGVHCHWTVGTY